MQRRLCTRTVAVLLACSLLSATGCPFVLGGIQLASFDLLRRLRCLHRDFGALGNRDGPPAKFRQYQLRNL